ncbi:MAG TPA: hypothetical protein PKA74_02740 [Bauldia sp.]|nr:hypothetical protein [Bauldia sp.]
MAIHWKTVKDEIEADLDRIMWEEPLEVKMSRLGVFPSGAGAHGQYLGNLFFLAGDMQAIGWWTAAPAMKQALDDPTMTVEHCKRFWSYMSVHMFQLMGDVSEPNCRAPWLNLGKLAELGRKVQDSFPTVETKEELDSLLWSWFNYTQRLYRWFFLVFPWWLGEHLPLKSREEVAELVRQGELPASVLEGPANWKMSRKPA